MKMSGEDEDRPSQRTAKTKRALSQEELEDIFDEEDDSFPSSEYESKFFYCSEFDPDEDEEVGRAQKSPNVNLRGTNVGQITTPTPTSITDWANDSVSQNEMKIFDFIKRQELLVPKQGNSPLDYFFLLVDEGFMNFVVQETNKNAVSVLSMSCTEKSRISA